MQFEYLADHPKAIPQMAQWYFEEWGTTVGHNSVEEVRKDLKNYCNRNRVPLIILAKQADEIVGTGQLKFYEMDIYPQKEHWLGGIVVPEKHRRQGIATKLVRRLIQIASSLDISTLYLQTQQLDGGLYAKLGWEPVEEVTYRGLDVLVMEKDLESPDELK